MHSDQLTAGALLRQARQRAGLSQVELAARAGVTQSVISSYESGHRQPSVPTLAAMIEAAGFELVTAVRRRPRPPTEYPGCACSAAWPAARTGPTATWTCSLTCPRR